MDVDKITMVMFQDERHCVLYIGDGRLASQYM